MSAGLVQLVAKGPQDTFLTGNPQVSFFRQNHKRYTPFSSTLIRQTTLRSLGYGKAQFNFRPSQVQTVSELQSPYQLMEIRLL